MLFGGIINGKTVESTSYVTVWIKILVIDLLSLAVLNNTNCLSLDNGNEGFSTYV